MPILLAKLLESGLGLVANAAIEKGQSYIQEKTGLNLDLHTEPTQEEIDKLREFQANYEIELKKIQLERDHIASDDFANRLKDVESSRGREIAIATSPNAPYINKIVSPILALVVIIGGGVIIATSADADVKMAANTLMTLVLGYYFGNVVKNADGK